MRPDDIRALFEPTGAVDIRPMFGGQGVYRGGRIIALYAKGGLWMKTDLQTRDAFEVAGSKPFTYAKPSGAVTALPYWSLPEDAFEDPDVMRVWVSLSEQTAARAAAAAPPKKAMRKP